MEDKFKAKLVIDPFSMLIVSQQGVLKRVFCPFWVRCRSPTETISINQRMLVDMVKSDSYKRIQYVIKGKVYNHSLFEILV